MTYDEFKAYVKQNALYETIYIDTEGREVLVICVLEAYGLMNNLRKKNG